MSASIFNIRPSYQPSAMVARINVTMVNSRPIFPASHRENRFIQAQANHGRLQHQPGGDAGDARARIAGAETEGESERQRDRRRNVAGDDQTPRRSRRQ